MTRASRPCERPDHSASHVIAIGFEPGARNSDPPTSHLAARVSEATREAIAPRLLAALAKAGDAGLTDDEISVAFPEINPSTARGARKRLQASGLIEDSGRTRPTRSGCAAIVWAIVS